MEKSLYFANLISRYLNDELTEVELGELREWLAMDDRHLLLFEELTNRSAQTDALQFIEKTDMDSAWNKILLHSSTTTASVPLQMPKKSRFIHMIAYGAVASIVIFALFMWMSYPAEEKSPDLISAVQAGSNKATLTLADGKVIELDGLSGTSILEQDGTSAVAVDGLLQYTSGEVVKVGRIGDEVRYNSIQTPRGGKYQLILSDGTKVWLNASSRLRYPIAFSGSERKVELEGEGYFEVKKNVRQPFRVNLGSGASVKVLGTSFNINSYSDEGDVRATLLEGKISFEKDASFKFVLPGQQIRYVHEDPTQSIATLPLSSNSRIELVEDVDVQAVIAWKNDLFMFNSEPVTSIMRQISRWYDIDIVYHANFANETFSGIVSSKSNLDQVLKIMEEGGVKFKLVDKTITVF